MIGPETGRRNSVDDQHVLMKEYFTLRTDKRRLAEEFRTLLEPIQSRMRAIEQQIDSGCDTNCATCPSPAERKGRILN